MDRARRDRPGDLRVHEPEVGGVGVAVERDSEELADRAPRTVAADDVAERLLGDGLTGLQPGMDDIGVLAQREELDPALDRPAARRERVREELLDIGLRQDHRLEPVVEGQLCDLTGRGVVAERLHGQSVAGDRVSPAELTQDLQGPRPDEECF